MSVIDALVTHTIVVVEVVVVVDETAAADDDMVCPPSAEAEPEVEGASTSFDDNKILGLSLLPKY